MGDSLDVGRRVRGRTPGEFDFLPPSLHALPSFITIFITILHPYTTFSVFC